MEVLRGKQLGEYKLIRQLGRGGMASVYQAFQPSVERYVALKVLPKHLHTETEFTERFLKEAKLLAALQHPNIVPVHDFGEYEGYYYIVMPYIEGGTLEFYLGEEPEEFEVIRAVISHIGSALDYAHVSNCVHRDVKPGNILVSDSEQYLLTDFGLAKLLVDSSASQSTAAFIGTPEYMSPEQCQGLSLDGRSDIYALGILLYRMTTGALPYEGDSDLSVIQKQIHDPLPSPRTHRADLSPELEEVVLQATAKDPNDRFNTAKAMVEALQAVEHDTTDTPSPPPKTPSRALTQTAPKKSRSNLLLFGITLILTVIVLLVWERQSMLQLLKDRISKEELAELNLYDNFDNIDTNTPNPELWSHYTEGQTEATQSQGLLHLSHAGKVGGLVAVKPRWSRLTSPLTASVRAKILSEPESERGNIGIYFDARSAAVKRWWGSIHLIGSKGTRSAKVGCSAEPYGQAHYHSIEFDTWYELTLRLEPQKGRVRCYVDGELIGEIATEQIESLLNGKAKVMINGWSKDRKSIQAAIDYLRLESGKE